MAPTEEDVGDGDEITIKDGGETEIDPGVCPVAPGRTTSLAGNLAGGDRLSREPTRQVDRCSWILGCASSPAEGEDVRLFFT